MTLRTEYRVPFMRVPAVLLAIATLLYANITTAMPPPAATKVSLCTAAGRPVARPHMAVSWVVHQAYRGNFHPIVTGIQIEVKKLGFELRTYVLDILQRA